MTVYCRHMPLVPMARPDLAEIERLIAARGYRSVAQFARTLPGRPAKSIYNIKYLEFVGQAFIRQIATALDVKPSQISDMEDDPEQAPVSERKMAS